MRLLKISLILLIVIGGVFAVSAQTGYGSTTPSIPDCGSSSGNFTQLGAADAAAFVTFMPKPTADAEMFAVFYTSCFGIHNVTIVTDKDVDCSTIAAYRVEINGNQENWPVTCQSSFNAEDNTTTLNFAIPGTGLAGHIVLYSLANAAAAPAGVILTNGA